MNRTLASFLAAAAVIGATGGTVAATTLASPPGGGSDRSSSRTDTPGDPASPLAPVVDRALWAERTALHDGDTTVALDLIDPPVDVQRLADGWLVNTSSDVTGTPLFETRVVHPDGTTAVLAQTLGPGEVSPDGTRYLAGTIDGYSVWDVETGDVVETVDRGWTSDAVIAEAETQAQYVDSDTVLTTWFNRIDGSIEVVMSDLGADPRGGDRRLVADDVLGHWGVSPDGRWLVASLLVEGDPTTAGDDREGCTLVRAIDGSGDDVRDCDVDVRGVPAFAADSSTVMTTVAGGDRDGEVRPLGLDGSIDRPGIQVPSGTLRATSMASDPDRVAVLARGTGGVGTVLECAAAEGCARIARADVPAAQAALGG